MAARVEAVVLERGELEGPGEGQHARPLIGISSDGVGYPSTLSDGTVVRGRALLVATGVEWRRLDTSGIDRLLGAGDEGGYLMTGNDLAGDPELLGGWPLQRQPMPLETNLPGVFAAGDVRHGSVKRCSAAIGEGAMAVALVHRRLAEVGSG